MQKLNRMLGLACTALKVAYLLVKIAETLMRITGGATNYREKSVFREVLYSQRIASICAYG